MSARLISTSIPNLLNGVSQQPNTVKLPNGCCVKEDCSINIFYKLFIEELSKNN